MEERDVDWAIDEERDNQGRIDPQVIEGYANPNGSGIGNWSSDDQFCPRCNYAWSIHDNSIPGRPGPFGCPRDDNEAAQDWGAA